MEKITSFHHEYVENAGEPCSLFCISMEKTVQDDLIICNRCGLIFSREETGKHCSNCFACTGCEIYYCPSCDFEIVITPKKPSRRNSDSTER